MKTTKIPSHQPSPTPPFHAVYLNISIVLHSTTVCHHDPPTPPPLIPFILPSLHTLPKTPIQAPTGPTPMANRRKSLRRQTSQVPLLRRVGTTIRSDHLRLVWINSKRRRVQQRVSKRST